MGIKLSDLKLRGSQSMPDDDTPTAIGGAIDETKKANFVDMGGSAQLVSSNASDGTQIVTISYRDNAGVIQTEQKTLNGLTPVAYTATIERLLKAIKNGLTLGDVAVENQAADRSNTSVTAAVDTIELDAGASAVDGFYNGEIIRITSGTGSGQIREIIDYVGSTKIATVSRSWAAPPDHAGFRIAKGFYFDKLPTEIIEARRIFYASAADAPGGVQKTYYEKLFFINKNQTTTLTASVVKEAADPANDVTFGLAASINDTGTNGVGNNRQVAPGGVTFDNADKNVPGGQNLASGDRIGVWLKLTLAAGAAAQNTTYTPQLQGLTT